MLNFFSPCRTVLSLRMSNESKVMALRVSRETAWRLKPQRGSCHSGSTIVRAIAARVLEHRTHLG